MRRRVKLDLEPVHLGDERPLKEQWAAIVEHARDYAEEQLGLDNFILGEIGSFGENLFRGGITNRQAERFKELSAAIKEYGYTKSVNDELLRKLQEFGRRL